MFKKLIQWLSSKSKISEDEFIFGLIFGLISGLLMGVIFGLIFGVIFGLIFGFISGLVSGLISGLLMGLLMGLLIGLGSVLVSNIITSLTTLSFEWYWYILALLLITEMIFWIFDQSKPKKNDNTLLFTAKRKVFSSLWALGIMTQILGGYYNLQKLKVAITPTVIEEGTELVGHIGAGVFVTVVVVLGLWIYISLNSLKYKR